MNITVTDREQCKKQLRLEIPGDAVRAETDKIAADLARKVTLPGFRRGHVPKSVVKTRFRKELRDEMLSKLLPNSLGDAIREKDLKVIGEPHVEDLKFKDDESLDVTFNIEVAPEFTLSNYKELPLTRRVYKVRDEDVENTVERLREGHAELVTVEDRASTAGDIVTVNLVGQVEAAGETPEEIKQQEVEIELAAPGVLKEFTEALTGVVVDDRRTFVVDYPADYKPEKFAGKRVSYTAEVTAVRFKELPEADDEFAHTVNDALNTIDELRADIQSKLEQDTSQKSEAEFRSSTMEKLVDRNRFDVPEYVVEKQIDSRMRTMLRQMSGQGMDPRQLKVDWEQVREAQRERAEREVRSSFILERIAETEKIEATEDEISKEIKEYADAMGQTEEAVRARLTKEGTIDSIKEQVRHRKALDLVIASADIRTEEIEGLGADGPAASEGGPADE
ncbi:MAG TPA: trigger factor [Blastocatellia bacterium]|nr:trigger factor [Blastocatellia bacterium]